MAEKDKDYDGEPLEIDKRSTESGRQNRLAYSAYVRDNGGATTKRFEPRGREEKKLSQVDFSLEDIKRVMEERLDARITAEREFTLKNVEHILDERFIAEYRTGATPSRWLWRSTPSGFLLSDMPHSRLTQPQDVRKARRIQRA